MQISIIRSNHKTAVYDKQDVMYSWTQGYHFICYHRRIYRLQQSATCV